MTLDEQTMRELADLVAMRLVPLVNQDATVALLDAEGAARYLGTERAWVYEHADELGAIRLGSGPRPRLRFDPATMLENLSRKPAMQERRRSPKTTQANDGVALLPVGRRDVGSRATMPTRKAA